LGIKNRLLRHDFAGPGKFHAPLTQTPHTPPPPPSCLTLVLSALHVRPPAPPALPFRLSRSVLPTLSRALPGPYTLPSSRPPVLSSRPLGFVHLLGSLAPSRPILSPAVFARPSLSPYAQVAVARRCRSHQRCGGGTSHLTSRGVLARVAHAIQTLMYDTILANARFSLRMTSPPCRTWRSLWE
ncbi:hypothetical protein EI94DRAFT_1875438, partial [Lactarius quietus]